MMDAYVAFKLHVSMKSGLEGRNNIADDSEHVRRCWVSMKSGLEGRNNAFPRTKQGDAPGGVSMKSGLEGRNNGPNSVLRR